MHHKEPKVELRDISELLKQLKDNPSSLRKADAVSCHWLAKQHEAFGLLQFPVLNKATGNLLGGAQNIRVLHSLGHTKAWVLLVDMDPTREAAAAFALNNHAGEFAWRPVSEALKLLLRVGDELGTTGFRESDYGPLVAAEWEPAKKAPLDDVQADPHQGGLF